MLLLIKINLYRYVAIISLKNKKKLIKILKVNNSQTGTHFQSDTSDSQQYLLTQ